MAFRYRFWLCVSFVSFSSNALSAKIGVIYPKGNQDGDLQCISMAVLKSHGHEPVLFDNENSIPKTIEISKVIAKGDFDAVLGTVTSQQAIVAAEQFEAKKTPFVIPMVSHPRVIENRTNVVRMVANSEHYAGLCAQYLVEEAKAKKVALVVNQSLPYSQFYADHVTKNLKQANVDVIQFEIFHGFSDYNKLAKSIDSLNPDAVYLPLYNFTFFSLFDALKRIKFKKLIFSNGGIGSGRSLVDNQNPKNPGPPILYNGIWNGDLHGPYKKEFLSLLKTNCPSQVPNTQVVAAFDAARILVYGMKEKKNQRKKIIEYIKSQNFPGLLGDTTFNENGDAHRNIELFKIFNGSRKYAGSYPKS